jgi:class 3 adenylate cyclase
VVAMFTRAREAVAAALDGQRGVLAEEWPIGAELRVRMALHTGAARLRDEGDDFAACGDALRSVAGGRSWRSDAAVGRDG